MGNITSSNGIKLGDSVSVYGDYTIHATVAELSKFDNMTMVRLTKSDSGEDAGWWNINTVTKEDSINIKHDTAYEPDTQLAAANALREAAKIVEERRKDYGDPVTSFKKIAEGWGLILGIVVKPHEVALCMDWLKTVRLLENPKKVDGWRDKAGYSALGEQIACRKDYE